MSSHKPDSTSQSAEVPQENLDEPAFNSPIHLTQDQRRRWASLIAKGAAEFPSDLRLADRELLLAESRRLLRTRLVRLVARFIAMDIHRDCGQSKKDESDA